MCSQVQFSWAEKSFALLESDLGIQGGAFSSYDGLEHSANVEELEDVTKQMASWLPPP